jgi:hypothetical protein
MNLVLDGMLAVVLAQVNSLTRVEVCLLMAAVLTPVVSVLLFSMAT